MELIKMKKALLCISLIIVVLALSGCSGQEEYPFDFVGLYDNKIQQSIEIGMAKNEVSNFLGDKNENPDGLGFYSYDDGLYLQYDDSDTLQRISVYHDDNALKRYELPGYITADSTVTDFIRLYNNIYEFYEYGKSFEPDIAVFLTPDGNGYTVLNKENLINMRDTSADVVVYQIALKYTSYDKITEFHIKTLDIENIPFETALIPISKNK